MNLGLLSYVFSAYQPLMRLYYISFLYPLSFTPSVVFLPLTNALLYSPLLPLATRDMPSLLTNKGTLQVLQTINRPNKGPQVNSIRDLHSLCGISDSETGIFKRLVFTFISNQDYVYFGRAPIRGMYLSSQDLKKALKQVLDEDICPKVPSQITVTSIPATARRGRLFGGEIRSGCMAASSTQPFNFIQVSELCESPSIAA